MPDWLRMLAQGLFWVVAMTLSMRWLARGRHRAAPAVGGGRVQHHGGSLATGVICMLSFVGVIVAASIWPDEGVNVWFHIFMTGFVLLGAYLVADWRYARHALSDPRIDSDTLVMLRETANGKLPPCLGIAARQSLPRSGFASTLLAHTPTFMTFFRRSAAWKHRKSTAVASSTTSSSW